MARELNEQQEKFLDTLFGEAKGDPKVAAETAGYADKYVYALVRNLKNEILQRAEEVLALFSPRAAFRLVDTMDGKNFSIDGKLRFEAAKQILDRAGLGKKEEINIKIGEETSILLLPAKNKD